MQQRGHLVEPCAAPWRGQNLVGSNVRRIGDPTDRWARSIRRQIVVASQNALDVECCTGDRVGIGRARR